MKLEVRQIFSNGTRKKQKEFDDARAFHEKNFQDCIDVNQENHYLSFAEQGVWPHTAEQLEQIASVSESDYIYV